MTFSAYVVWFDSWVNATHLPPNLFMMMKKSHFSLPDLVTTGSLVYTFDRFSLVSSSLMNI